MKRVGLYVRVSTINGHQSPDMQLNDARPYCQLRGWTIVEEYIDKGVSGAKANRPELDRLMADARRRKFDVVLVWKFDRFARSTSHLLKALEEFKALNIDFVSLTEGIDTSTPMGKMVFTVLGAVAELERSLIVERVNAGVRLARSKGRVAGPKPLRLDLEAVKARLAAGESQRQIAKSLGVSPAFINKRLKADEQAAKSSAAFDEAFPELK